MRAREPARHGSLRPCAVHGLSAVFSLLTGACKMFEAELGKTATLESAWDPAQR